MNKKISWQQTNKINLIKKYSCSMKFEGSQPYSQNSVIPRNPAQVFAIPTCVLQMRGSNLARNTHHFKLIRGVPQTLHTNVQIVHRSHHDCFFPRSANLVLIKPPTPTSVQCTVVNAFKGTINLKPTRSRHSRKLNTHFH
jgi:hypothetical protein